MSLRHLILTLVLAAVVLLPSLASADRFLFHSNSYYRNSYHYGEPPTFPPQPHPYPNVWYKWGYFGAYPAPRTGIGGHYSHRNQYTELRFSAPK